MQLEFELIYYNIAAQHIRNKIMRTNPNNVKARIYNIQDNSKRR